VEEKIIELLNEKFASPEFADCYLVELKILPNKRLEVFVDCDSGLTLEKCQKLSRYLEHYIDEAGWLGGNYVLEVSSPGLNRPLQLPRQYAKNIGRKVEVSLVAGGSRTGQLTAVDATGITIEEKVRRKDGKRTVTELVATQLPFEAIDKTIVKASL
jgi:ribosome maturation factor RimP